MVIAQASINENGKITGGKLGNQNGKELNIKCVKKNNFKYILRFVNPQVQNNLALIAWIGAQNEHIGYDQTYRNTLWREAKKELSIGKIKVDCGCDCSSFVTVCAQLAYYSIFKEWLPGVDMSGNLPTTSNMIKKLRNTGRIVCYEKKEKVLPGDILVTPGKHTAIVVDV